MDHRQFDDAIRALHRQLHLRRSATRRQGILAAIAVAFGGGAGAVLARGNGNRPVAEGPCKGLKRPDNTCTRDSECCTKVCNLDAGKANRDGLGRCRCKHAGESCTADRNCCQRRERPLACVDGVCGSPAKTCTTATCPQGCCRGTTCVPFANQTDASCGMKGAVCAPCNSGFQCVNGSCVPLPTPTPTPAPTPPPPACATSCTGGCCDGSQCVLYANQNASFCGSGGAPCLDCTAAPNPSCNNGTCQYA